MLNHIIKKLLYILLLVGIAFGSFSLFSISLSFAEDEESETSSPRIAVVDFETDSSVRLVKYLTEAGFDAVRIEDLQELDTDSFDALALPGGHNITPSVYGAEPDKHTYGTDLKVDNLQIEAVHRFAETGKPILGICRGEQVVNVAFGGTIDQHIPGWHKKYRDVTILEGSWLYGMLGETESVYHYHHQCVDELGEGLYATQWDAVDGHIEAYEHESLPVYGLQWHPDSMDERGVEVFRAFRLIVEQNMSKEKTEDAMVDKALKTVLDSLHKLAGIITQ